MSYNNSYNNNGYSYNNNGYGSNSNGYGNYGGGYGQGGSSYSHNQPYDRNDGAPGYNNASGSYVKHIYAPPGETDDQRNKRLRRFENDFMRENKQKREADLFWQIQRDNVSRNIIPRSRDYVRESDLFRENTGNVGIDFQKYNDVEIHKNGNGIEQIPEVHSFHEIFELFTIQDFLEKNIKLCKYDKPTPVQRVALPAGLCGRDVMCCAQTGSGKTAAYLVPIIGVLDPNNGLENFREPYEGPARPKAIVLAPTRELCVQIFGETKKFAYRSPYRIVVVYGGADAKSQLRELARGVDIIVATPGRLIDFVDRGVISLNICEFLVLDEADRMLDMGFEPQIRTIVEQRDMIKDHRQTLLFSATFPSQIQKLAQDFLTDYIWITVGIVGGVCDSVEQQVLPVESSRKFEELVNTLRRDQEEINSAHSENDLILIFVGMKKTADWLSRTMYREFNIPSSAIHGDLSQSERERSLADFRCGRSKILVATDVASRGLDIPHVGHVINYDMPNSIDEYVHRIGRTGRIGHRGKATSLFVTSTIDRNPRDQCDSSLAADLVHILEDGHKEIPEFLRHEAMMFGGSGKNKSSAGKKGKHRFGGQDIRGRVSGNYSGKMRGNFKGGHHQGSHHGSSSPSHKGGHYNNGYNNNYQR